MKGIISKIEEVDFISYQPRFYVNGRTRFKNIICTIFILIMFLIILYNIVYFCKDVLNYQKPTVFNSETMTSETERINLNERDFNLAISLSSVINNYRETRNERIYIPKLYKNILVNLD